MTVLEVELRCKRVHLFLKGSRVTLCGKKLAGHYWSPRHNGSSPMCEACLRKKAYLETGGFVK